MTEETLFQKQHREYLEFDAQPALGPDDHPPMFSLVRDPLGVTWRVNRTRCVIERLPRGGLPAGYGTVARWSELAVKSEWLRRPTDGSRFRWGYGPIRLIRLGRDGWLYETIR